MDILQKKREVWAKFLEICPARWERGWLRFNTSLELIDTTPRKRVFSICIPDQVSIYGDIESSICYSEQDLNDEDEPAKWMIADFLLQND